MLDRYSEWRLCRRIDCTDLGILRSPEGGGPWSPVFLRPYKDDAQKMAAMRRILAEGWGAWALSRMSNEDLIKEIVEQLNRHHIHLHVSPIGGGQRPDASSAGNAPAPAAFPLSERQERAPVSSRRSAADPPTFSPAMDPSLQAATLTAASASGKPFCPE